MIRHTLRNERNRNLIYFMLKKKKKETANNLNNEVNEKNEQNKKLSSNENSSNI